MDNILNITNRKEFREWLYKNSSKEVECYIKLKRGKPIDPNTFYYIDAVEEALCFGWIDSTLKRINNELYQRFSKRSDKTVWTELNKERVRRLIKLGLMEEDGYKVLPDLDINSFKIDPELINILKNEGIYEIFMSFHPLYIRVRAYNITFYKNKNKELYAKALAHFIKETKNNKMYGLWNDYNRLLSY
jgi:uncharacterized protein YdeI (YjbR/CyaY-like superfamily)